MNTERPVDPIARAFELAKSGKFASVSEIRKKLKIEQYDTTTLVGRSLLKQLRDLINESMRRGNPR